PLIDKYIEKLQSKGIKTAVCTNNFPERLENLMKRFKLHEKFDVIVASYQVGVTKPDTRIFKTLAKRLGLNPHEILMSDDIEANVDALKALGFQAFLYTGLENFTAQVENKISG